MLLLLYRSIVPGVKVILRAIIAKTIVPIAPRSKQIPLDLKQSMLQLLQLLKDTIKYKTATILIIKAINIPIVISVIAPPKNNPAAIKAINPLIINPTAHAQDIPHINFTSGNIICYKNYNVQKNNITYNQ